MDFSADYASATVPALSIDWAAIPATHPPRAAEKNGVARGIVSQRLGFTGLTAAA